MLWCSVYLYYTAFLNKSWTQVNCRGGSRTVAISKMERFVIIVNAYKPLAIISKRSILDVTAVLDPYLHCIADDYKILVRT